MPIAIVLAIWGGGFWWSLAASAIAAGLVAQVLATLWIGRVRAELRRTERANPLQHLYHAKIQGLADTSLQIRFIFMQALSGALIGAMWFAIAAGVVALVT
jgi:hypothetical protein